jgi:hypothetical protein
LKLSKISPFIFNNINARNFSSSSIIKNNNIPPNNKVTDLVIYTPKNLSFVLVDPVIYLPDPLATHTIDQPLLDMVKVSTIEDISVIKGAMGPG